MLLGTDCLDNNIIWVILDSNIWQIDHGYDQILPHLMIGDNIMVIIEGTVWNGAVVYHALIASQYLICPINSNSNNQYLLAHFYGKPSGNVNTY